MFVFSSPIFSNGLTGFAFIAIALLTPGKLSLILWRVDLYNFMSEIKETGRPTSVWVEGRWGRREVRKGEGEVTEGTVTDIVFDGGSVFLRK